VIIGAQRSGTTSLYRYLAEHPAIQPARVKELHFFDLEYRRGLRWYRSFFPSRWLRSRAARSGRAVVAGEATPYYLFHPHVPRRIARDLPGVRLLAILRNPVDRAWSQHRHEVAEGRETLPFAEAVRCEEERLAPELARLARDEHAISTIHQHHSYLARGRYAEQLERWLALFPRERLLVLGAEALYADPAATVTRVHAFLGVEPRRLEAPRVHNPSDGAPPDAAARAALTEFFRPHNRRLFELLGADLGWPS
jgi:hypothetical protein